MEKNYTDYDLWIVKAFGLFVLDMFDLYAPGKDVEYEIVEPKKFCTVFDESMEINKIPYLPGEIEDKFLPIREDEWDLVKEYYREWCSKVNFYSTDWRGDTLITEENYDEEFEVFKTNITDDTGESGFFRLSGKIVSDIEISYDLNGKVDGVSFQFLSNTLNTKRHTERFLVCVNEAPAYRFINNFKKNDSIQFTAQRIPYGECNAVCYVSFTEKSAQRIREYERESSKDEGR